MERAQGPVARPTLISYMLLAWLALFALSTQAAPGLVLKDRFKSANLAPYLSYYCDPTGQMDLAQAQAHALMPLTTPEVAFGYRTDSCWFRFHLHNQAAKAQELLLVIPFTVLDRVELFSPPGSAQPRQIVGDTLAFESRTLRTRPLLFNIDLPAQSQQEYWLRVQTAGSLSLPLRLEQKDRFIEHALLNELVLGLFYGVGVGLFFYNLFLWLAIRERAYLFYVLHVGTITLFFASLQGLAFRLWPEATDWNSRAPYFFAHVALLFGALFAREYLFTQRWPRLDRAMLIMSLILLISACIQLILPPNPVIVALALLTMILLVSAGLLGLRQRIPEARIFALAWGSFLLTCSLFSLDNYGLIRLPGALFALQLGIIAQQVLLSFGLAQRINSLKQEKQLHEHETLSARAESEAKSDFLAKMSHEIRTPMNAVLGISQLLQDTRLNTVQRRYVQTLDNAAQTLLQLLNDVLDYSKLNAGKLELEQAPFKLTEVLGECVSLFAMDAQQKQLSLEFEPDTDLPTWVQGDAVRIKQVLINLLSNALKFTEQGHIRVLAHSQAGSRPSQVRITLRVQDTGIGLSPAVQSRLFQSFSQADASTSRRYGGSGLGLAIAKQLVEAMGGDIGLSSREGLGSTFWFSLELELACAPSAAATAAPAAATSTLEDMHVLVVEDNPVNQLVITGLLSKLGVRVSLSESGAEALHILQSQHQDIDLILMDCEMPVMDGYETSGRIRAHEAQSGLSRLPIVALTAHALSEHRERCLEAGMDDHLSKPIALDKLRSTLQGWRAQATL